MFDSAPKHLRWVATIGVAAALAVGGVAAAQGGSSGSKSSEGGGKSQRHHRPGPGGGPPGLGPMKGLTYAEFHVQTKNGEARTIRLDQGKIAAVDADSITVTENDGNEVTIAVDEDTKVLGKPGSETGLDDLKTGQRVAVSGPEGGTAKVIMLPPKKGEMKGAPGGPPPADRRG